MQNSLYFSLFGWNLPEKSSLETASTTAEFASQNHHISRHHNADCIAASKRKGTLISS
jgi:hypothetical protein